MSAIDLNLKTCCEALWLQLNSAAHPDDLPDDCTALSFDDVRRYFATFPAAQIIRLSDTAQTDHALLEREGISLKYLLLNLRKTIKKSYWDSRAFQLAAIKEGAIRALCPFSGRQVASSYSFLANVNTIFYRFQGERVFYVAIAGIGLGFEKCAVYIPGLELIVTTGDAWSIEQDDLIELRARMVANYELCRRYLSEQAPRRIAVCLGYYHFAHHIWNELSGVYRLKKSRLLKNVDQFLIMREPLGPLTQIFPEIPVTKCQKIATTTELFIEILTQNYLAVRVGDTFIPSDLTARVDRVAISNCEPSTHAKIETAKQNHSPLLWIGIKVGERTWLGQANGLAELIIALNRHYPRLGVVFDGFSLPADKLGDSSQEYSQVLAEENAVVAEVAGELNKRNSQIEPINIIGSSIYDAILWAKAIDCYVAPFGSLQHKVGWFTRRPGIIHTNQNMLGADYIWTNLQSPVVPRYVDRSAISAGAPQTESPVYKRLNDRNEVGLGIQAADQRAQGDPQFDSYSVDWRQLYNELLALIQSGSQASKMSKSVLKLTIKQKARTLVRSIVNALDPYKI